MRRFFARPTPLQPNGASSITNQTDEVRFSVQRGHFDTPFRLTLACETPGAVIRYTTNGSPPLTPGSLAYTEPLAITGSTVIRAAALAPDRVPSRSQTHTYLVGLPPEYRAIPSLSLVTDTNNLYGRTGIMEVRPRNTTKRGPEWERPVSMEYLEPGTGDGFQVDAGIRIQGGDYIRSLYNYRSSNLPESKYSFRLYFRGEYGQGRLQWRLFPNTTVASFDTIVLRAGMNDPSNPFLKDEFVRQLSSEMGQPASHGTFVHLFLNGAYRGYYNPAERIDPDFLQAYHVGGDRWDVVAQMGEVREGDGTSWSQLISLAQTRPATNRLNHLEFARRVDLTNFVDYLLPNIYVDADDWPHNNWRAAREAGPGGLWRFYVWDAEWSFGQPNGHSVSFNTINAQLSSLSPPWGTTEIQRLFNALKRGREFQMLFSDRVHRAFFNGGPLEDARIRAVYEETKARLNTARTIPGFNNSTINSWINGRRRHVLTHLGLAGFNRSTNATRFAPFGGPVAPGTLLDLSSLSGAIYYTLDGTDPRVPFTESIAPTAQLYRQPIVLDRPVRLKARSLVGWNDWSALSEAVFVVADAGPSIRFSEIMYNPPGGDPYEFIELVNVGGTPADLSGFSLDGVNFRFPSPFPPLAPGAHLVLANEDAPDLFAARYPNLTVAGFFSGSLNNGGETLSLRDRAGQPVESLTWSDQLGWPTAADGGGRSLERSDLSGDPNALASWHPSAALGGSPAQPNSTPVQPSVRLHEVSAQPGDADDWIELHNPGSSPLDLSFWSLTDDPSLPRRWIFPAGSQIPPNGFLVVRCQPNGPSGDLVAPFGLSSSGEQIVLFNPQSLTIDSLAYGPQAQGFTTGRDPLSARWILCEPSPGSPNEPALLGQPREVRLNEFLADSDDGDDWIELHNPSPLPVALSGGFLLTSNATFRISAPAFLAPGGFATFIADENPGPNHLNFKLPAAGGMIEWRTPDGLLADRVEYRTQIPGVTSGRLPDASGPWTSLPFSPTPGDSNHLAALGQSLRLSEFMAVHASTPPAPDGQPADWIELHQSGTNTMDLSGVRLQLNDSTSWTFPQGTSLAPEARLLVWATERSLPTGTPQLPQSLPDSGGVLRLLDARGRLLDQVTYGFQLTHLSAGRAPDDWALLASPTPAQPNSPPAPLGDLNNVRLNEWLADASNPGEWIELFNPNTLPVNLAGCFLSDDISLSGLTRFEIGPLSFIPAQGFVQFDAEGSSPSSSASLPFRLSRWGESIRLSSPNQTPVDQVDFGIQTNGQSEGRVPDGSDRIIPLFVPTPLAPNREAPADQDGDGMPDDWELVHQLNPNDPADAGMDPDGDGRTNWEEFVAGTHPADPASALVAGVETAEEIVISFQAMPQRSYSVLRLEGSLESTEWTVVQQVEPAVAPREIRFTDPQADGRPVSLYRIVTPALR